MGTKILAGLQEGVWLFLSLPVVVFCLAADLLQVSVNGAGNTRGPWGDCEGKPRVLVSPAGLNSSENCTQTLQLQIRAGVSSAVGNVNPAVTVLCAAVGSAHPAVNGSVMVGKPADKC